LCAKRAFASLTPNTYTLPFLRSDDAEIFYEIRGNGPPVVLLHPFPCDHEFWNPIAAALDSRYRLILPDLRGHGDSEIGEGPALVAKHASDLALVLDAADTSKAAFIGCSIGGYVLLELWRRAPERMRALAFICSKPQPDAEPTLVKRAANIASIRESGTGPLFDGMAQSLIGATVRGRRPEIVNELRVRMTLTADAAIAVQAGLATRPDSAPTVATITVPVFAIAGGEDTAISPVDMEAFRAAQNGCCDYHVLPDAGHFAAYEQPEKVAALMAEWLREME